MNLLEGGDGYRRAVQCGTRSARRFPRAVVDWIVEVDPEVLLADGFEDAILGMGERCSQPPIVVYDGEKCLAILMERDGLSYEEAAEFFSFNVTGAWVGERTPLFLWRPEA